MKKTFVAMMMLFASCAGALAAFYVYLRRRERELNEYEQLLFSDDFAQEETAPFDGDMQSF